MKNSLLPFRRTKSNVDYNDEPKMSRQQKISENSSGFSGSSGSSTNDASPVSSKFGLLRSIQSTIRRTSLRIRDDSDHGFLQSGPRRANSCIQRELSTENSEKNSVPNLRVRRAIPWSLTIENNAENNVPKPERTISDANINISSSLLSPIPPKVPHRSAVSLGLIPNRTLPKTAKTTLYEIPSVTACDQLSPTTPVSVSPIARSCFPVRPPPKALRALPPIPAGTDCFEDCPPEENAPAPPSVNLIYRPSDESFCVTEELQHLAKCGWYWGPISRWEAEKKLENKPDGTFLVRNSLDPKHLLSLSFRSVGKSLHARIEYENCKFSFYPHLNDQTYPSVVDLVESAMAKATVCYSRSRDPDSPTFPVRLQFPVSRFAQVTSLKYLCRFTIRLHIRLDHLEKTPLPESIRRFLSFPQLLD